MNKNASLFQNDPGNTLDLIVNLDRLSAHNISQKEHLAIFNPCQKQDIDAAIKQLTTHLRKASKRLMAILS